jgi:hypothetical protein
MQATTVVGSKIIADRSSELLLRLVSAWRSLLSLSLSSPEPEY